MTGSHKTAFTVADLDGTDAYKLATGLVVPRPIGWVGTVSSDGVPNLAPYSFFNAVSGDPPTFVFSPGAGDRKDTLTNVRDTSEFTLNVVTSEVAPAMNETAATVEDDVDEFVLAGLTAVRGDLVKAPMVAECRANIECRVTDIVHVGRAAGGNELVIGEAVRFHIDPALLDGTRVDQAALRAVGRHAGNMYSNATDLFELIRPA